MMSRESNESKTGKTLAHLSLTKMVNLCCNISDELTIAWREKAYTLHAEEC